MKKVIIKTGINEEEAIDLEDRDYVFYRMFKEIIRELKNIKNG